MWCKPTLVFIFRPLVELNNSHLLQNQGIEKGGLMLKSQDRKKAKYAIFFQHFVDTLFWYIKPIGK